MFSTRCVDLSCARASSNAVKSPDIFSRPPWRSNAGLLDLKDPQQIPYKQIITPRLADCFQDDPGGREATVLSFGDN